MSARQDAVDMSHALDQVAAEKDKLWDVAEQLAVALRAMLVRFERNHVHASTKATTDQAHVALAEWEKISG